jgi:two-component system sensor histidine kinase/response regulator
VSGPVGGRVLVVDDQEPNRLLLHDLLQLDGYQVHQAANGLDALALAGSCDPDVVLLDVSMPGMDGFEVCRRLKADARTAPVPVLLVTALDQRAHRLEGIAAGANDYLVKPIDRGEVSLRVRNAVRMRVMHRTMQDQFHALQRLERMRDDLVAMLAHDLRSPLTGLRGFLELAQDNVRDHLAPGFVDMLSEAIRSVDQLNGMIGDMLDVSRMESEQLPLHSEHADLLELAQRAAASIGPPPAFHLVHVRIAGDAIRVQCDPALIQRVLLNLMANAVRFSPSHCDVMVTVLPRDDGACITVRDRGPGIALHEQERIFDKFAQAGAARTTRTRSTGLGLTFCRMVVERHGGRIGVTSAPGAGSEFWVELPKRTPD